MPTIDERCYGHQPANQQLTTLRAENERWKATMKVAVELGGRQEEELTTLRARVAELKGLVESAYAEGFYRAQQPGVDWDNRPNEWRGSQARAALGKGEGNG